MPARSPDQCHPEFERLFNERDLDGLVDLYEEDAVLIAQPGMIATGKDEIRAGLQGFLDLNGQISLSTKKVLVVGDLAYLSNRWSLEGGTDPDGNVVEMGSLTNEIVRRQDDGTWLMVFDNAWGDLGLET